MFLILAALYESWSLPFSVLLSTPVAVFGAFATLWLRRTVAGGFTPAYMVQIESDVYAQIGLVMLIGLTAKNAILIVEFAKDEYEQGKPLVDAALAGARIRLRPILMTSFAFILGSVPLWIATGAGSVARQIIGTTVIGGMLAASFIAIFWSRRSFISLRSGRAPRAPLPLPEVGGPAKQDTCGPTCPAHPGSTDREPGHATHLGKRVEADAQNERSDPAEDLRVAVALNPGRIEVSGAVPI